MQVEVTERLYRAARRRPDSLRVSIAGLLGVDDPRLEVLVAVSCLPQVSFVSDPIVIPNGAIMVWMDAADAERAEVDEILDTLAAGLAGDTIVTVDVPPRVSTRGLDRMYWMPVDLAAVRARAGADELPSSWIPTLRGFLDATPGLKRVRVVLGGEQTVEFPNTASIPPALFGPHRMFTFFAEGVDNQCCLAELDTFTRLGSYLTVAKPVEDSSPALVVESLREFARGAAHGYLIRGAPFTKVSHSFCLGYQPLIGTSLVRQFADILVPDAFSYMMLGPGHQARLPSALQKQVVPVSGSDLGELWLGDLDDWLGATYFETRAAARAELGGLLAEAPTRAALAAAGRVHSHNDEWRWDDPYAVQPWPWPDRDL